MIAGQRAAVTENILLIRLNVTILQCLPSLTILQETRIKSCRRIFSLKTPRCIEQFVTSFTDAYCNISVTNKIVILYLTIDRPEKSSCRLSLSAGYAVL